jgi:RecA-family ATPase
MTYVTRTDAPVNGAPPQNPAGMSFDEWRKRCPYGKWTCADGREVIFNRAYWPILERRPGEQAKPARSGEWVESIVADESFWDDFGGSPQFDADALAGVNRILADWGFPPLPPAPRQKVKNCLYSFKDDDGEIKMPPPRVNPWDHPFGAAPEEPDDPDVEVDVIGEDYEVEPMKVDEETLKELQEMRERWKKPIPGSAQAVEALRELHGIHVSGPLNWGTHYNAKCPECFDDLAVRAEKEKDEEGREKETVEIECWCHECGLNKFLFERRPVAGSDAIPLINMRTWDDEEPPQQEWAVCSRIPVGHTALFSGEGGAGKSLIMLQLAVDVVRGMDWFDAPVKRGPALILDAEDDEKVIHKRLFDILEHHELAFADVRRNLHVSSLAGKDAVLATFDRKSGKMAPTELYDALLEMVGDIKPVVTGIAASADVFAGDEIDRSQVRQFIAMLTRVAQTAGGAVVLISHPSLSGINSGSGLSGSTAWHNSVRSRFYLKGIKPKKGDDDDAPDTDMRVLEFRKNNYGPVSEAVTLRYQNGLFVPATAATADQAARETEAEHVFLSALNRFTYQKQPLSPNNKANNYAPYRIAEHPEAKGFGRAEMRAAMQRLLDQEKIHIDDPGPRSRPSPRLVAGPRKLV